MIVVDASALFELLLNTPAAASIARRMAADGDLHAPHLIDVEVSHALRRYLRGRQISELQGQQAISNLLDFAVTRYSHVPLLPRISSLRDNLTPYDAAYVALAEALDAPLLTRDGALAAAPGHHAQVEVI